MKTFKFQISASLLLIFLTSCSIGIHDLKRSSSNKLIDSSGFHANKRRPLYNGKYIKKAKENIINSEYEEEEIENDEISTPSEKNISMYKKMLKKDEEEPEDDIYDSSDDNDIVKSRKVLSGKSAMRSKTELEREIKEIKTLLSKTREDIAKSKCPYEAKKTPTVKDSSMDLKNTAGNINDEVEKEVSGVISVEDTKKHYRIPFH